MKRFIIDTKLSIIDIIYQRPETCAALLLVTRVTKLFGSPLSLFPFFQFLLFALKNPTFKFFRIRIGFSPFSIPKKKVSTIHFTPNGAGRTLPGTGRATGGCCISLALGMQQPTRQKKKMGVGGLLRDRVFRTTEKKKEKNDPKTRRQKPIGRLNILAECCAQCQSASLKNIFPLLRLLLLY